MTFKQALSKYWGLFLLAISVVVFYKFFDSLNVVTDFIGLIFDIMIPFVVGAILAYMLNPLKKWVEKYVGKSKNPWIVKKKHSLSVLIVFFSFLFIVIVGLIYLIPTLVSSIGTFLDQIPDYITQFKIFVFLNIPIDYYPVAENVFKEISLSIRDVTSIVMNFDIMKYVLGAVDATTTLFSYIMGILACPYILFEIHYLRRLSDRFLGLFLEPTHISFLHDYLHKINKIFIDFIIGKGIDSLIIGIIALVFFHIMDYPFATILALVILITNMIPYFGPFIGGIPVALFVLMSAGFIPFVTCGIFIFILQQFDGWVLGPAVLGDSVGISAFWILFAVTFFGGLFGVIGMFLGVPMICVIRMIFNDYCEYYYNKKETQIEG